MLENAKLIIFISKHRNTDSLQVQLYKSADYPAIAKCLGAQALYQAADSVCFFTHYKCIIKRLQCAFFSNFLQTSKFRFGCAFGNSLCFCYVFS